MAAKSQTARASTEGQSSPFLRAANIGEQVGEKKARRTPVEDIPIQARGWHLLLREPPVEQQTKGGIWLSDHSQKAESVMCYFGEVVSMGEGCFKHPQFSGMPTQCEVGDYVIVGRYAGQKMSLASTGEVFRMITDVMVMGVVSDPGDLVVYAG